MKTLATLIRLAFLGLFIFLVVQSKPMLWLVLYVIGLITTFLFGRYYCGYICPMNTIMRPIDWLAKKLGIQTKTTPRFLESGKFAWFTLFASLAVVLVIRRVAGRQFPVLVVWLVLAALITLRYRPAVFHNLICPFGAPLKLVGNYSRNSQYVNPEDCIGCGKCIKPCPSNAITIPKGSRVAQIETNICHQCQDCRAVCPENAIKYGSTG